jgi:diguanylate cyclase (GGDEF)-like protein
MLDDGARTGMVSIADPDTRFKVLSGVIDAGRTFKENVKMENGRVIAVLHQPMPGGGWLSTHEDVTEQHSHEEKIRHLARHDALTDLPNRVLFREEMDKIEARMRRGEVMAVLQVDLDRFKDVNDRLGHAVGDAVLIEVARRMREASRETDVVARIGGDEFALLVGPLESPRQAARIADRIVKSVARPLTVEGNQILIGASIGIAMAPPDGTDPETLMKNADLALYKAKGDGRGAYRFFEQAMDDASRNRRALELSLRDGLAGEQFRLVFQPLFNLAENRIAGLEALLRWDHPERGLIAPGDFLPLAEETGMIVGIGDWVLREACRAAAGWPENVRVAVNLSPVQFRHRGLIESVEAALTEAALPPDRLELEITEQLLSTDTEATLATLNRLRAMGVRIALDDFGLEHSSLRHLQCFRFDKVKVDRSFVKSLLGGKDSMAVVTAMIGLGHSLGLATTAEGIETEEELEAVRAQGCEEVQGFLFSAPLPASGADALLATTSGKAGKSAGMFPARIGAAFALGNATTQ